MNACAAPSPPFREQTAGKFRNSIEMREDRKVSPKLGIGKLKVLKIISGFADDDREKEYKHPAYN